LKKNNNTMKNTAWYDNKILHSEMVNGALGINGWQRLEFTPHFKILKEMVNKCQGKKIVDLGCGAGELGRLLCDNYEYTGLDLPHIINEVAKIVNPNLNYEYFDANEFDYSHISKYDIIICNGFISELTNPLEVIEKIINNTKKNLIIHRQFFSKNTEFVEYNTYGNLKTPRSYLGHDDFSNLLINHEIVNKKDNVWGSTLLISRK